MPYSIPGFNTLLLGATGTGKTHCIQTLLDAGISPFVVFTEPGMRTLAGIGCDRGLHWRYIEPARPAFLDMADSALKINQARDLEAITKQKNWNKSKYQQFIQVVLTMNCAVCDRCGEDFGGVDDWGTDRALVIDSLSGLNIMAMDLAAGAKPVKAPADWGTAMDNLERFINRLCTGTQCHFILTAHLEREKDEVTGSVKLMPSTLGVKLAPKVPRYFDDVIQCDRKRDEFLWTTGAMNVDLKARNVPISDKLQPSFVQVAEAWGSVGGIIMPKEEPKPKTATA